MGTHIQTEPASKWRYTHYCDECKAAIRGTIYVGTLRGKHKGRYCSMACARKALGIEAKVVNTICPQCRPACANYEPEAEPFGHTNCPCLATEPEAEVWEWHDGDSRAAEGQFGQELRCAIGRGMDGSTVLFHEAYWKMEPADMALIAQAPQTAANLAKAEAENARLQSELDAMHGRRFSSRAYHALKARAEKGDAAEAEIVRLTRFGRKVETQNAKLRDALKAVRGEVCNMGLSADCVTIAKQDALGAIDAALGQDGAK